MIERTLFRRTRAFRDTVGASSPITWRNACAVEEQGYVDRDVWLKAGEAACLTQQSGDLRRYRAFARQHCRDGGVFCRPVANGPGFGLHSEIVAPYCFTGSEKQKHRYLPRLTRGQLIGAIAIPSRSRQRPAGHSHPAPFWMSGLRAQWSKTFITNGWLSDLVIVVAKTDPGRARRASACFLVERGMPGSKRASA